MSTVTRENIIKALINTLEPLDYVYAMWEGGAAAFDRLDEWSDLDLQVDAEDDRVDHVFELVEQTLSSLSPIDIKFELPRPTWHGHAQTFYRLQDTSPFLMIDFVIMQHNTTADRFMEKEIHGEPLIHFDKANVVKSPPVDRAKLLDTLQKRLDTLRVTFDLFQILILKELYRQNYMEAVSFYHRFTLQPLIEVLRIKHTPFHYNFNTRYLYYELSPELVQQLEPLHFIANGDDLWVKREQVEQLFYQTINEIARPFSQ